MINKYDNVSDAIELGSSNELFIQEFSEVFYKMLNHGYGELNDVN